MLFILPIVSPNSECLKMRGLGSDAMSLVRSTGVLLLRYSVGFTVESLSLFYLLFIRICTYLEMIHQ